CKDDHSHSWTGRQPVSRASIARWLRAAVIGNTRPKDTPSTRPPKITNDCTIGAHTHGVALPAAKAAKLQAVVGTMVELKYLKPAEVATVPRRAQPLEVAAYAPIGQASFDPNIVIFRGNVRQIMLISEAAGEASAYSAREHRARSVPSAARRLATMKVRAAFAAHQLLSFWKWPSLSRFQMVPSG